MSRLKWTMIVLVLALGGAPAWACDAAPASTVGENLFGIKILPAVLHIPGPGEEPLYGGLEFVKAPPILPENLCEARCLADFRECQCWNVSCLVPGELLLNACAASCASSI